MSVMPIKIKFSLRDKGRGGFILTSFKSWISDHKLIYMDNQGYDLMCFVITIGFLLFRGAILGHLLVDTLLSLLRGEIFIIKILLEAFGSLFQRLCIATEK